MTKDYLRSYRDRQRELQQLEDMLMEIEARMSSPRIQQMTGMPASPSPDNDQMLALVDKHLQLKARYLAKMDELAAEQLEIETAIDSLEPFEREMFRLRYIQGVKWEDICVRMNYSWRQIHRAHKEALIKLEGVK